MLPLLAVLVLAFLASTPPSRPPHPYDFLRSEPLPLVRDVEGFAGTTGEPDVPVRIHDYAIASPFAVYKDRLGRTLRDRDARAVGWRETGGGMAMWGDVQKGQDYLTIHRGVPSYLRRYADSRTTGFLTVVEIRDDSPLSRVRYWLESLVHP